MPPPGTPTQPKPKKNTTKPSPPPDNATSTDDLVSLRLAEQIFQSLLQPLTLYANSMRAQTFTLPEVLSEDPTIKFEVAMRGLSSRFTSFTQDGVFRFMPKEQHVGSYNIELRVKDIKSGQLSRPVNWKIEVLSHN